MKPLTEKQLKSLSALWAGLPDDIRSQLLAAAGKTGRLAETLKILDDRCSGGGSQDERRSLLFRVFDDVTGQKSDPPTHSRFTDEILTLIDKEADLASLKTPAGSSDPGIMQSWRNQAAERLLALNARAEKDRPLKARLTQAAGTGYESLIVDAVCLLSHDAQLTDALKPFDKKITDFTPDSVSQARDAYDRICADAPDASLWFLKLLTARLTNTAQIFRVVEKIGRRSDDALVSKTDLADVGDMVLANADFYAGKFDHAPATLDEAGEAGRALQEFAKISVGMTREFGIRKDGRWGKTLFAIRAKASNSLDQFFKQVEKDFVRSLPYVAKGNRGFVTPGSMPKDERILRTESELAFLALAADWATKAAVGGAQKHAADYVRQELDDAARAYLEILRAAQGEDAAKASAALDLIVRYMHAFKDDENAELIQRRSVAVRANAA